MSPVKQKDQTPKFTVGESVWVCPSNRDDSWYTGTVVHILKHDEPLQNNTIPHTNMYIIEVSSSVADILDMVESGRLHKISFCRKNTVMHGEHDCERDIHGEIAGTKSKIAYIELRKKYLLDADIALEGLKAKLDELEKLV